jgi:hypothetical protein
MQLIYLKAFLILNKWFLKCWKLGKSSPLQFLFFPPFSFETIILNLLSKAPPKPLISSRIQNFNLPFLSSHSYIVSFKTVQKSKITLLNLSLTIKACGLAKFITWTLLEILNNEHGLL